MHARGFVFTGLLTLHCVVKTAAHASHSLYKNVRCCLTRCFGVARGHASHELYKNVRCCRPTHAIFMTSHMLGASKLLHTMILKPRLFSSSLVTCSAPRPSTKMSQLTAHDEQQSFSIVAASGCPKIWLPSSLLHLTNFSAESGALRHVC